MVTHTPHFPRFVTADRLVPDLERLKKNIFWSLKIRPKSKPLGCDKTSKKYFSRTFFNFFLSLIFPKLVPIDPSWRIEKNEGYEWPVISKNLVRRPIFEFCSFFHFWQLGWTKLPKDFLHVFRTFCTLSSDDWREHRKTCGRSIFWMFWRNHLPH